MRKTLVYFAAVCLVCGVAAWGQQPAQRGTAPNDKGGEGKLKFGPTTDAEKLLDQAIAKLEALEQYRTDIRQVVEMLGYRFTSSGQYAVGPDMRMLFELKVQLTDTTGTVLEVCDGRIRWRSQNILDTKELERLDVRRVRHIIEKPQFDRAVRDRLGKPGSFSGVLPLSPGVDIILKEGHAAELGVSSGILPLVRGLRETQTFDTYEEGTLAEGQDDTPVYILHGHWREEALAQVPFRGQKASPTNLPAYMPGTITVWIGRETGWPHRVDMESSKKDSGTPTLVKLEFLTPQIGVELPDSLFTFDPPAGVEPFDQSDFIRKQLNTLIEQSEAEQKAKESSATSPASPSAAGTAPIGIAAPKKPQ